MMLHTAAVRLMQEDPRLIERALGILDRWMQASVLHSRPLLQEWQRILLERDWDQALSKSERGNQLRQASPVSCILPNKQRLDIIGACKTANLQPVGREIGPQSVTALKGMVRKPAAPVTIAAMNAAVERKGMSELNFTQSELVEISDAINEVLARLLGSNDPSQDEKKYGTLTLLQSAQSKIMPAAFGFRPDDTPWGPEQAKRIEAIRTQQGLPEKATAGEIAHWAATVTRR